MVPYRRSQSRQLKASGSRSGVRVADVLSAFRYTLWCLAQAVLKLWDLNPASLVFKRWQQLHHLNTLMALSIRPRLIDLATDFFLSDERRKRKLLSWVKSILPCVGEEVLDFSASWQDGIVLCTLMTSISQGACPGHNQLKRHHRVNNCRLGLQLAMQYLQVVQLPLSPEEMAIADEDSELQICSLVQLLKWKYQKQGKRLVQVPNACLEEPLPCKCQARGTGIRAGIVGRRAKFNILTESVSRLDLQIEIRGPHNEYNRETIISVSSGPSSRHGDHATGTVSEDDGKSKVIEDGAGHRFLRQKSLDEDVSNLLIPFDYQCVGEGRFLVTYIPRNAGLHYITVLSGGVNIQGSPFEVKVSDWVSSWNLVPKQRVMPLDMLQTPEERQNDDLIPAVATDRIRRRLSHAAEVSKQNTRLKRRILRKVITPNGEEIICEVLPASLRQARDDPDVLYGEQQKYGVGLSRLRHTRDESCDNVGTDVNSGEEFARTTPKQSGGEPCKEGFWAGRNCSLPPEIIITSYTEEHVEGREFVVGDVEVDEYGSSEEWDTNSLRHLPSSIQKEADSSYDDTGNTISLVTVTPSRALLQKSFSEVSDSRCNAYDLMASPGELPCRASPGRRSPCRRTPSPSFKVSDIVDTVLDGLKQDRHIRSDSLSPITSYQRRCFSVDDVGFSLSPSFIRETTDQAPATFVSEEPSSFVEALSIDGSGAGGCGRSQTPSTVTASPSLLSSQPVGSVLDSSLLQLSTDKDESTTGRLQNDERRDDPLSLKAVEREFIFSTHEKRFVYSEDTYDASYSPGCEDVDINKTTNDQDTHRSLGNVLNETKEIEAEFNLFENPLMSEAMNGCSTADRSSSAVSSEPFSIQSNETVVNKSLNEINQPHSGLASSFDFSDLHPKDERMRFEQKNVVGERKLRKSFTFPYRIDSLTDADWPDLESSPTSWTVSTRQLQDGDQEHSSSDCDEGIDAGADYQSEKGSKYEVEILNSENVNASRFYVKNDDDDGHDSAGRLVLPETGSTSLPESVRRARESQSKAGGCVIIKSSRISCLDQRKKTKKGDDITCGQPEEFMEETPAEEVCLGDEEILQVIIESGRSSTDVNENFQDVGESSLSQTTKPEINGNLSINKNDSYHFSSEPYCGDEDHETSFSTAYVQKEDYLRKSSISNASNKSGNSDWSENDNCPGTSANQKSRQKNSSYYLGGDWSPQFVDLSYHSRDTSRRSSTRSASGNSPSNLSQRTHSFSSGSDYNTETLITNPEPHIYSQSSDYVNGHEDKELGFKPSSQNVNNEDKLENESKGVTLSKTTESQLMKSSHFRNRNLNTCNHDWFSGKFVDHNDDDSVGRLYLKKRRKPLYIPDISKTTHAYKNQGSENISWQNIMNNNNVLAPNEPCLCHQDKSTVDDNVPLCHKLSQCTFFSTLQLLSPEISDFLLVDNWSSLSSSYAAEFSDDSILDTNYSKTCLKSQNTDVPGIELPAGMDWFEERTLTPTKYRKPVRLSDYSRNSQRNPEKYPRFFQESSNIDDSTFRVRHHEDYIESVPEGLSDNMQNRINYENSQNQNFIKTKLGPGDRILTPTKFRRQIDASRGSGLENACSLNSNKRTSASETLNRRYEAPYPESFPGSQSLYTSESGTKQSELVENRPSGQCYDSSDVSHIGQKGTRKVCQNCGYHESEKQLPRDIPFSDSNDELSWKASDQCPSHLLDQSSAGSYEKPYGTERPRMFNKKMFLFTEADRKCGYANHGTDDGVVNNRSRRCLKYRNLENIHETNLKVLNNNNNNNNNNNKSGSQNYTIQERCGNLDCLQRQNFRCCSFCSDQMLMHRQDLCSQCCDFIRHCYYQHRLCQHHHHHQQYENRLQYYRSQGHNMRQKVPHKPQDVDIQGQELLGGSPSQKGQRQERPNQVQETQQKQRQQQTPAKLREQQQNKAEEKSDSGSLSGFRRQSTVDTLDSGITEDSWRYSQQISYAETVDSGVLDTEDSLNLNLFTAVA